MTFCYLHKAILDLLSSNSVKDILYCMDWHFKWLGPYFVNIYPNSQSFTCYSETLLKMSFIAWGHVDFQMTILLSAQDFGASKPTSAILKLENSYRPKMTLSASMSRHPAHPSLGPAQWLRVTTSNWYSVAIVFATHFCTLAYKYMQTFLRKRCRSGHWNFTRLK